MVQFMAETEPDRAHWVPSKEDLSFPHRFWSDWGPTIEKKVWHLNPGLVRHMIECSYEAVIVGGPWDSLTALVITVFGMRGVERRIAWGESNTWSPGRQGIISRNIKRFLLQRYTTIAVPGEEGRKVFESILDGSNRRFILLPNIVDESCFRTRDYFSEDDLMTIRVTHGLDPCRRFALWPARLISAKGIEPFISELTPDMLGDWQIGIFGNGPLETKIRSLIEQRMLSKNIRICDLVKYEEMPLLYAAADLFLLPSWHDPNPLSVVEAMFSGLPVLLSCRVGNYPEALHEGINGWGLDPSDPGSVRRAVDKAFGASTEQLREMGLESIKMAKMFWDTKIAVNRFLDSVLS